MTVHHSKINQWRIIAQDTHILLIDEIYIGKSTHDIGVMRRLLTLGKAITTYAIVD